jgi:cysteine-S-conjugate beta-lyase
VRHDLGMTTAFDNVDVDLLRRRRTVKWTLYGPEVLAAWVAEMDFDVAPVVRATLLERIVSAMGAAVVRVGNP